MDKGTGRARWISVLQGERRASGEEGIVLSTVLGSCVAACMFDPVARVGGMNHFLLPGESESERNGAALYGAHLMELLVNDLMKMGAQRGRLQTKLFGGGQVVRGLSDIGRKNVDFAMRYLAYEGISLVGSDVGGDRARRLQFWPTDGRARVRYTAPDEGGVEVVRPSRPSPGEITLF